MPIRKLRSSRRSWSMSRRPARPPLKGRPMSDLQSQDYIRRSASTLTPPSIRDHEQEVAKLIDVSRCIGCKACQAGCMDCEDPGCLKACPAPGAIVQYANGIVDFISENCIGCGYCVTGCPFNIPRINPVDHKSYKCTLCSDRVSVGLEPACAKACPTQAISFGTKNDMVEFAQTRIADLNERGYEKAGLYDPPGVGGTHVMYVLQHADRPELYAGLPKDPKISPLVEAWKGAAKPLALVGLGLTALFGFLHYVTGGPNEVEETDEEQAKKTIDERGDERGGR